MKKIYFAAPLFNEMELKRNEEYTNLLEQWGYEVYLPQREAGQCQRSGGCQGTACGDRHGHRKTPEADMRWSVRSYPLRPFRGR